MSKQKMVYKIKVTRAKSGSFEGYIKSADHRTRLYGFEVIGSYEAYSCGLDYDSEVCVGDVGDISFQLKDGGYSKAQLDERFDTDDISDQILSLIDHREVIQDARDAAGDAAYEAYRDGDCA